MELRVVVPSMNVTEPEGVPEPDVTAAANVTACPIVDGFRDDDSVVVVATAFTTWFTGDDVLAANVALPA
jgi:hypothetical protein